MPGVVWSVIAFNKYAELLIFDPAKKSPVTVRKKPLPEKENSCEKYS